MLSLSKGNFSVVTFSSSRSIKHNRVAGKLDTGKYCSLATAFCSQAVFCTDKSPGELYLFSDLMDKTSLFRNLGYE